MRRRSVLVVAPTGRDGQLIADLLARHDVVCEVYPTIRALSRQLSGGAGAIVLTDEALVPGTHQELANALEAQPPWSDIPVILLASKSERLQSAVRAVLQEKRTRSIVLMQRPVSRFDFLSAIETALESRMRQYEIRDYLEERARNEERLRHSQRLESIGSLAGGIAHDFNNLLTGVLGNASLALDHLAPDSPARPMLRDVIKASEQAALLTQQMLAYAGKGRFVLRMVDLSQMVEDISTLVTASIPRSVQLQHDLKRGLPKIEADAAQIQQIVMNLVINGAEAIPQDRPGLVRVTTYVQDIDATNIHTMFPNSEAAPGRYVALEVRDNGIGMDAATLERIFDPFFSTKFTGRGLGLAAVLGIVKGHHGALKIESALGEGTTFTVLFPAAERAAGVSAPGVDGDGGARRTDTVLVVDDEEFVRRVAKTALERMGFTVLVAESGRVGVDVFRERSREIALVLLDMTMPDLGGEDVFRRMLEIRRDVKVIVSTGYDEAETARHFVGMQLAGFVQKPYTPSRLGQIITAALGRD